MNDPKNTGHGHVRPRPDGVKMRCGGPSICAECAREAAAVASEQASRDAEIERLTASCKGLSKLATAHGKEIERLRGALHAIWVKLDNDRVAWEHQGDEDAGQCDEDCRACEYEALREMARCALDGLTVQPPAALSDDEIRLHWRQAGGEFHGPHVETGTMPEALLLPFLRGLMRASDKPGAAR